MNPTIMPGIVEAMLVQRVTSAAVPRARNVSEDGVTSQSVAFGRSVEATRCAGV
jgi:hypothetical protein